VAQLASSDPCAFLLSCTMVAAIVRVLFLSSLAARVCATDLTSENWDSAVAGKAVFIKFQAPW